MNYKSSFQRPFLIFWPENILSHYEVHNFEKERNYRSKISEEQITQDDGAGLSFSLNLTVFGLMAATLVSDDILGGEVLKAHARMSENDLKLEHVGLEATGLAITTLSAALLSIMYKKLCYDTYEYSRKL